MLPRLNPVRVLVAACVAATLSACGKPAEDQAAKAREAAYKEKYAKAEALFKERCKTAGVVVKRTVKDVEGIELLKVRPEIKWGGKEYFDPMFEGAAMAGEATGEGYFWSFLRSEYRGKNYAQDFRGGLVRPERTVAPGDLPMRRGFRFVDVMSGRGTERIRYTIPWNVNAGEYEGLAASAASEPRPRYAVDYEDIVDPADRALWIAGTKLKVIDQSNGEVIAQLTRYVWDPGFGVSTTGRWPWQHASSVGPDRMCPVSWGTRGHVTRFFVDTVLIPIQGD